MLSVAFVYLVVFVCNTVVVRAFPTGHVRCGHGRHCHIRLRHSVVNMPYQRVIPLLLDIAMLCSQRFVVELVWAVGYAIIAGHDQVLFGALRG